MAVCDHLEPKQPSPVSVYNHHILEHIEQSNMAQNQNWISSKVQGWVAGVGNAAGGAVNAVGNGVSGAGQGVGNGVTNASRGWADSVRG